MNWNFQRSKDRLAKEWARIQEAGLNVQRLTREMDLSNLSPTDARIVHGAHIYCHIANFSEIIDSPLMRRDDFKRLHRLLHILRVEQRYTLQQIFGGDKIQVQGPKFHGLLYKPYDDDQTLAWKSVLAAIALKLILTDAVQVVFPEYPKLRPSLGLSLGDCLVANIGARGERELISVGGAANYAAKIMNDVRPITITSELYSNLDEEHQKLFTASSTVYVLDSASISDAEQLLEDEGYGWNSQGSSQRMAKSRDYLPLDDINSSEAQVRIDFDLLGPKTVKTCSGSSVFVHVAVDRDAVPVQHQGDRLQALTHLPLTATLQRLRGCSRTSKTSERPCSGCICFDTKCDEADAMRRAVDLCIDCNSSMEEVLNEYHADLGKLHVAIGADFGKTVAIRSGVRGDLDAGCLGHAVGRAEHLQFRSAGGQMTISKALYEILDDEVIRQEFVLGADSNSYVAKGLTWTKIEDLRKKRNYESKASVGFDTRSSGIVFEISGGKSPDAIPLKQTRPWGTE